MLELCIDSSAGAAVAIVMDGQVLSRVSQSDPRRHAENLGPLVNEALRIAKISNATWDRVCVGTGPAPFTGLRSGLMTAAVLARVWGIPIFGVCSLSIIGRQALDKLPEGTEIIVATDARRQEVYWAKYVAAGPNSLKSLEAPQVSKPAELTGQLAGGPVLVVGPGAPIVQESIGSPIGMTEHADPAVLSRLVSAALAADPQTHMPIDPLYLRRPDIHGRPPGTK